MERVYLDYNATTPLRPEALEAMVRMLGEDFGNPSSVHWAGAVARDALSRARGQVAALAGAAADRIVFTSGATEANNTVIAAAAGRAGSAGGRVVTCATEHPSVLETCEALRERGLRVVVLPVAGDGRLDPDRFEAALLPETLLASVMWVNNETGVVQPVPELARRARARGVPFHTDAVQALGKLPVALDEVGVDFASFSAHKLGGPKGLGALYARAPAALSPLLRGGPQERRRRAGTENVAGVVGFGVACELAAADLEPRQTRLSQLRDRIAERLLAGVPDVVLNAPQEHMKGHTVEHTLNVSFPGADAETLVMALDIEGIAVASGAACASGSTEPSHVLLAMGLGRAVGASAIRISLGFDSSEACVERLLEVLPGVVERARAEAGAAHPGRAAGERALGLPGTV